MRIVPLDFLGQGALITPADPELHDKVIEFCQREISEPINLTDFRKVWIALEGDEVKGVMGCVLKPDVPVMRAITEDALRKMADRYNDYLADIGYLGQTTFIYVRRGEKPECQCPGVHKILKEWGAKLADRVEVTVR